MAARRPTAPRFPDIELPNRQYGLKEGVPAISFSAAEYQAAAKRLEYTLIAKFQIGRPPLPIIKNFLASQWNMKGRVTVSTNWDDRHVIIILDSEEDVKTALTCPNRKVGHTLFRLFRWTVDYNPRKEVPRVTKWVRLPGLPMELFDKSFIKAIISSFAYFLDIDDKTKEMSSLNFARACVELDVTKDIPGSVWINLPGERGFYQDIVIEGSIEYCTHCKLHGHSMQNCRKRVTPVVSRGEAGNAALAAGTGEKREKEKSGEEWVEVRRKKTKTDRVLKPVRGVNIIREGEKSGVDCVEGEPLGSRQEESLKVTDTVVEFQNKDQNIEASRVELVSQVAETQFTGDGVPVNEVDKGVPKTDQIPKLVFTRTYQMGAMDLGNNHLAQDGGDVEKSTSSNV